MGAVHFAPQRAINDRVRVRVSCSYSLSNAYWDANLLPHSADQAYREGFDSTLYGRNHLDYIIAIPLRALRRYDAWRKEQGLDSFESPGVKVMVKSARIQQDHAVRLHEILLRIALKRMTGAGAHEGTARRPGDALPYGYEF